MLPTFSGLRPVAKKITRIFKAGDSLTHNRLRRGGRERLLEVVDHVAGLLDRELLWVG
jgi:hypothetical protein